MTNSRAALVAKYGGEDGYRAHMRAIRARVSKHPGGAFRNKRFAKAMSKKGLDARWREDNLKRKRAT